jgi:F-type H+-transporting ATPase subunit gamma
MNSARDNVSKKLQELRATERLVRQEEITTELIEIAAGAEALGEASRAPPPRA